MQTTQKATGRAASIPAGLACGGISAILMTLVGTGILAKCIDEEVLQWKDIGYGIMAVVILTSWISALLSVHMIRRRRILICTISGILYFAGLLVMTGLLFGGKYSGVGETGLLILCGSALAILTGNSHKKQRKRHKRSRVNR